MNKAAGMVTMWKISKKVQEVERFQYWCSRMPKFLLWILGQRGSLKAIHIDGSSNNLVIGTLCLLIYIWCLETAHGRSREQRQWHKKTQSVKLKRSQSRVLQAF